jgi:transcriptional regulator NrdR family protein
MRCPDCDGMATIVEDTRPDPDHALGPTVWRRRRCRDCERVSYTAEVEIAEADALAAFARLKTERRVFAGRARPGPATLAGA